MWVFQETIYKPRKQAVESGTAVFARENYGPTNENYGQTNSGFLLKNLDSKHPYMFEVCDASGSGKFQNPAKLINMAGEVLLDYDAIRRHPKYSEALRSLGISEDELGHRRFTMKNKTISDLEAHSLVQNYVFLSDQCPTSTQAELSEAARAFYKEGIVIIQDRPIRLANADEWALTFVRTLDLNQTGMIALDHLIIYGFSDSDKNVIHSDSDQKYDDKTSNYVRSLNLRVNLSDFGYSQLYTYKTPRHIQYTFADLVPFTSVSQLAELRKTGLESFEKKARYRMLNKSPDKSIESILIGERTKLESMILRNEAVEGQKDKNLIGDLLKVLVGVQEDLNMITNCKKGAKQNP